VLNIPVVDQDDHFISLVSRYQTERNVFADVAVVLMVGGLGKRLHPLTENCPKPMLPVGGRPLLERIIGRFRDQGFRNFFLSINYLGHQIEEHFGTGAAFGVSIAYLREDMKLGTAGALSLLPSSVQGPMIVMNGDVITELDFRKLVDFHKRSGFAATMCTREHRTAIPFGVVEHDVSRFAGITEKPTIVHQINAGVYCVEADCARIVPQGKFYDMPDLFADLHEKGHGCGIYKISDHWVDIGNLQDYERANSMFANVPSDT